MNEIETNTPRIKGVSIAKPIVYGNISRSFGKPRDGDGHTHQWTIFVKPYRNEDLSIYVKKIQFKLHDSYANNTRVITKPPYEVTETGWGEFEVNIKIFFNDTSERPLVFYHVLRLFQHDSDKKQLIVEHYDELIFQDPSCMMQQLLSNNRPIVMGFYKHETAFEEKKDTTLASVMSAKTKIHNEILELKQRLKQSQDSVHKFKKELNQLDQSAR